MQLPPVGLGLDAVEQMCYRGQKRGGVIAPLSHDRRAAQPPIASGIGLVGNCCPALSGVGVLSCDRKGGGIVRYKVMAPWGIEIQLTAPGDVDLLYGVRPSSRQEALDSLLMDLACMLADERACPMADKAAPTWECAERTLS